MELITGATGFIGRHLALRRIAGNRPVRVLVRPASVTKLDRRVSGGAEIACGDLTDPASLRHALAGVSRVYHCAGHVSDWGTEAQFRAANVEGTRSLLEAAGKLQRFVHLSSIAVFGVPSPAEFDDSTPYSASPDLYCRTKIEGERVALSYHRERGVPVTVLRPAVVYGPYSTWLEEPLRMIQAGKMFLLGGGKGTCHPCSIENLLDAIQLVAERPEAIGQAYSVSDDDSISFREYFDTIAAWEGKAPIRRSIPLSAARALATAFEASARLTRSARRPLLTHSAIDMVTTPSRMSIRKIRNELQYRPRHGFHDAMRLYHTHYTELLLNRSGRSIHNTPTEF